MIKRKTIQKIVFCLAVFLACQNNSFARLIEPEPKPNEFKNKILKINNTKQDLKKADKKNIFETCLFAEFHLFLFINAKVF
jgi:hypothetical protein